MGDYEEGIKAGEHMLESGISEDAAHLSTHWNPMDSSDFSAGVDEAIRRSHEE